MRVTVKALNQCLAKALLLLFVSSPLSAQLTEQKSEDTIVTFNALCASCARNPSILQSWDERRSPVFRLLRSQAPDLMAIQELEDAMLDDFVQEFSAEFDHFSGTLYDESRLFGPGHLNVIFYRANKYRLVRGGSFRLGNTSPSKPDIIGDASLRTCTWAVLTKLNAADDQFRFLSCHFPFSNLSASKVAAQTLADWLWKTNDRGLPQVVAGDFNLRAEDRSMQYLLGDNGQFSDFNYPPNWVPLTNDTPPPQIDHVLHNGTYKTLVSFATGTEPYDPPFACSDHPLVVMRGEFISTPRNKSAIPGVMFLLQEN